MQVKFELTAEREIVILVIKNDKTILVCSNYGWTIYNFRMALIRRLKSEGYRVIVITQFDGYEHQIGSEVDDIKPLFISRKGVNPLIDFFTIVDLMRYLLKFKPYMLLTFSVKPVIYGSIAAKLLRVRTIAMITGLGTVFITDNWVTKVVKMLYRYALSSVSVIFFQNIDDRNIFVEQNLVDAKACRFTPGSGVDLDKFSYCKLPNTAEITFLLVARMLWDKGVGEFVEAAKIVKSKYPRARFQLLGPLGVQNRTAIPRQIVEKWHSEALIEYLGETDDVKRFIKRSCCVVLPSYREGTSRVLLEGAAMGRPLIAADVTGCREIVNDGVSGLLCEPRDSASLAQKIELMIEMSYENRCLMGIRGREKVQKEFSQEIVCDIYVEALAD